jgi:alpha-L-arabinofuranosidase
MKPTRLQKKLRTNRCTRTCREQNSHELFVHHPINETNASKYFLKLNDRQIDGVFVGIKNGLFVLLLAFLLVGGVHAQDRNVVALSLDATKIGAPVQPTMYGLFIEDINFAADGGLYAELVKNRSFDFPQNLMGWKTFGNVKVMSENAPFPNNPTYLALSYSGHQHKHTGIENEGFTGIGFKKGDTYRFSVWAKNENPDQEQKLRIEFINSASFNIGHGELLIKDGNWKQYELVIPARATEEKGRLRIFLVSPGTLLIDHVSLFPTDTWMGRKNGLRKDLAQALYDIKPGVFRFPGGCIVEGTDLDTRYNWKKSVGPVENRSLNENRWHYTFRDRFFPDYYQTYGLGFFEYFLLSKDLGAEPLPVLSVGLSCQFQNKEMECHVPLDELQPYIQDALDLIEFANGPVTSEWGKMRAEMGHPESFNLKFLGVGNEQWGPEYVERLDLFVKTIRQKYPEIKIIGSSGPSADGDRFNYLWPEMKRLKVDLVDEHYYKDPDWFLKSAARYDTYDRKGPAVFAGEYACHVTDRSNNFYSAMCEAAFMTGLERNADIVHMCTYAPLFAHIDAWQWRPDMIWYDNLRLMKTPNYYVQQMYSHNSGTNVAELTWEGKPVTGQEGLYASAVFDANEKCYIVKLVNTSKEDKSVQVHLSGLKKNMKVGLGECIALHSKDRDRVNSLESPFELVPQRVFPTMINNQLNINLDGQTFGVYKILL